MNIATATAIKSKNQVTLTKNEYVRLKNLDRRFGQLLSYFAHCADIATARQEAIDGKVVSQDKLFKQLGLKP